MNMNTIVPAKSKHDCVTLFQRIPLSSLSSPLPPTTPRPLSSFKLANAARAPRPPPSFPSFQRRVAAAAVSPFVMSSSSYIQPKAVHASDQFKGNLQSLLHGGKSPAPFIMPDFRTQSSSAQPASYNAFQNIVSQSPMPRVRTCAMLFSAFAYPLLR